MQALPLPPLSGSLSRRLVVNCSFVLPLLTLAGCVTAPKSEPPVIARKPRATPLPGAILQIDVKPSTTSLQPASEWSQHSVEILSGETPK